MTDVSYSKRWTSRRRSAVEPLDPDEARRRHEAGELYTAIIGDPDRPRAYVEVRPEAGFVSVHFLDDDRRDVMEYVFARDGGDGDLFLEQVIRRELGDGGEPQLVETHFFDRGGIVHVEKKDYATRMQESFDVEADVSGNWEPMPEFGRYESIARVER
jgi:hypothetical protein